MPPSSVRRLSNIFRTYLLKSSSCRLRTACRWEISVRDARTVGLQSYVILSLCRTLYAIQYRQQISKVAAGEWASREFPEWSQLMRDALRWRGSSDKSDSLSTQAEAIGFVEFAIRQAGARN